MKKINKILAAILTAAAVCGIVLLTACSKYNVDAYCIFDGQRLRLDISYDSAYTGGTVTSFRTSNSLDNIKGEIDKMTPSGGTLVTTRYSNSYLLVEYSTNDGGYHVYMVVKYSEGLYEFECPYGFFGNNQWLMPYHLLGDNFESVIGETNAAVEPDTEYTTSYTMQDFYNFYQKVAEYEATIEGSTLTLQWTNDGQTLALNLQFNEREDGQTGVTITLGE